MALTQKEIFEVAVAVQDQGSREKVEAIRKEIEKLKDARDRLIQQQISQGSLFPKESVRELAKTTAEIDKAEKRLSRFSAIGTEVAKTLQTLDKASPRELQRTIKSLQKELNSGHIERGSDLWKQYARAIEEAKGELARVKEEMRAAGEESGKGIGGVLKGIAAAAATAKELFTSARAWAAPHVEAYAAIDDAMAQVTKYTGLAREEVEELNAAFKKMDTRTSQEQLNALAADAGRLGLQGKEEILAFVEAADLINVALGEDLGEGAVKNIGKLADIFGASETMGLKQAMLSTASVINELAQSSSASEGYILEFVQRIAGAGKQIGLTYTDLAGYASAFDQLGINVERTSTALQNTFILLNRESDKVAEAVGLNVGEFQRLLKEDANEALLQLAGRLNELGGMDVLAPILKDLHLSGSGVVAMLTSLAQNTDRVRQAQQTATAAFREGSSVSREAAVQNSTLSASLEKCRERMARASAEIGQKLAPAFVASTNALILFSRTLAAIISVAVQPWFIGAAAGVAAYTVAINAATIADKLKVLWSNNIAAALKRMYAVAAANPWAAVAAAIGAVIGLLATMKVRTEENSEAQQRLAKAQKEAEGSAAGETLRLRLLYEATQDQTLAMDQRTAAAEEMQRLYPGYFSGLSTEAILAGQAADAYADLTQQIINAARARAIEGQIEEIEKNNIRLRQELKEAEGERLAAQTRGERQVGGEIAYGGPVNQVETSRWNPTIRRLQGQLATNESIQQQLAAEVNTLRTSVNTAAKGVTAATAALSNFTPTASIGGRGGGGRAGGSGRTGAGTTTQKETPQERADRERQERLDAINRRLQQTDLRPEVRTVLQALAKKIQQDILANPHALLPDARKAQEELAARQAAYREAQRQIDDRFAAFSTLTGEEQAELRFTLAQLTFANERQIEALESQILEAEAGSREMEDLLQSLHAANQTADRLAAWKDRSAAPGSAGLPPASTAERQRAALSLRENALRAGSGPAPGFPVPGLSETAAQNLAKAVAALSRDLAEGTVTAGGYQAALDNLFTEAANQTALEELEKKLRDIRRAEAEGIITHRRSLELQRQAKREREEQVSQLTPLASAGSAPPQSQAAEAVKNIYAALTARRRAEEEIRRLEEQGVITHEEAERRKEEASRLSAAGMVAAANEAYSLIGSFAQQYTAYLSAARDAEVQRVTASYDAQLRNTREGSKRYKEIEEQKQRAVAAAKNKYNKRAQKIELAQAIAGVAQAAINAYSSAAAIPLVGHILAPIAAAAATAAGMLQVAAIRKQHEAQAEGYAQGGYTPPGRRDEIAGVVHRGEFVATQEAVSNPAVRPLLDIIDQAQRSRTVSRLRPRDLTTTAAGAVVLSAPGSAGGQAAAPAPAAAGNATGDTALLAALDTLNGHLARGITATVALDGPDGLHRQYTRYKRLL